MRTRLALLVAALIVPACAPKPATDAGPDGGSLADASDAGTPSDSSDAATVDAPPGIDAPATDNGVPDAPTSDAVSPADSSDVPLTATWCSMGREIAGITVPAGFCLRRFVTVNSPRTIAFAPNGDLLVGAPTTFAPGGSNGGPGAVMLYADDNRDGSAEAHTFIATRLEGGAPTSRIPDVHGIAIGGGHVYFTTTTTILRVPYTDGLRTADPSRLEDLRMPSHYASGRWTHGLARSVGGTLYTSGGMIGSSCGGISSGGVYSASTGTLTPQSDGYRNPMYLRCHPREELCVATELGEDQTPGAREKIVRIRPEQHYGYPCCFSRGAPMSNRQCDVITPEEASFTIGDTPFGLDWERGSWPAPFRDALFVAMHGSFYTSPPWLGAGVRYWPTDPVTHLPTGASAQPFVTGVGAPPAAISRPSDVTFSPDGRMFFSDDVGNAIYWVAPTTLRTPPPRT